MGTRGDPRGDSSAGQGCWHLEDEQSTERLGARLAKAAPPGLVIYLQGELGSGKTTLVRGFLRRLGHQAKVRSPTYTLVEAYRFDNAVVYHLDLYRLADPAELDAIGVRDCFDGQAMTLVEWPERGGSRLAPPDLRVRLSYAPSGRDAAVQAFTERGFKTLEALSRGDNSV